MRQAAAVRPELAIRFEVTAGALRHWNRTRVAPDYAVALDAAHFSAYRARRFGFRPILSMGGGISYRVVMPLGRSLVEREELRGLRIAARPAPGLAALRLLALFGPTELPPELVAVQDEITAVRLLHEGRVSGALVSGRKRSVHVEPMLVLDEVPGPVLSVSGALARLEVEALREILLDLGPVLDTASSRRAGLAPFRPHKDLAYADLDQLLRYTWGFEPAGRQ